MLLGGKISRHFLVLAHAIILHSRHVRLRLDFILFCNHQSLYNSLILIFIMLISIFAVYLIDFKFNARLKITQNEKYYVRHNIRSLFVAYNTAEMFQFEYFLFFLHKKSNAHIVSAHIWKYRIA